MGRISSEEYIEKSKFSRPSCKFLAPFSYIFTKAFSARYGCGFFKRPALRQSFDDECQVRFMTFKIGCSSRFTRDLRLVAFEQG